jgi:hypothetical protein
MQNKRAKGYSRARKPTRNSARSEPESSASCVGIRRAQAPSRDPNRPSLNELGLSTSSEDRECVGVALRVLSPPCPVSSCPVSFFKRGVDAKFQIQLAH